MFEGFERKQVTTTSGVTINLVHGGSGPPLLLLHGYPQTHLMWHKVAPRLAQDFTVIAPDLRGYGDSSKPHGDPEHLAYSKRVMAQDQVEVMGQLGFEEFCVAAHDRGARVAHRMALDHPQRVRKLALLDIRPTRDMFGHVDKEMATSAWHWFFLIQPYDLPERLIGASSDYFLRSRFRRGVDAPLVFPPEVVDEYARCFCDPAAIHATARTTVPPPPLTWCTMKGTGAEGLTCRCWSSGGRPGVPCGAGATCWKCGGSTHRTSRAVS